MLGRSVSSIPHGSHVKHATYMLKILLELNRPKSAKTMQPQIVPQNLDLVGPCSQPCSTGYFETYAFKNPQSAII